MAQRGADEHLEAHLGGDGVAGQADDGRAGLTVLGADGAHTHDVAGPGGDVVKADGAERTEDLSDGVATAVGDAAGRQNQVRAHQLVLDGLAQASALIRDRGDAEGLCAGVSNGRRQGVTVRVEDSAGAGLATGLDDLVADRDDDDARARVDQHAVTAHAGEERHLAGTDTRAGAQHRVTLRNVLRATANVLAAGGGGTQGDLGDAVIRELEGDHGLGAGGHGRAGRDTDRGAGHEGRRVDSAGADLLGDRKRHRRLQGGSLTVADANGVSVARRQVGDREVEGGPHVLCEHAADRVSELNVERRQRVGNGHAVLVEVGNASHSC